MRAYYALHNPEKSCNMRFNKTPKFNKYDNYSSTHEKQHVFHLVTHRGWKLAEGWWLTHQDPVQKNTSTHIRWPHLQSLQTHHGISCKGIPFGQSGVKGSKIAFRNEHFNIGLVLWIHRKTSIICHEGLQWVGLARTQQEKMTTPNWLFSKSLNSFENFRQA